MILRSVPPKALNSKELRVAICFLISDLYYASKQYRRSSGCGMESTHGTETHGITIKAGSLLNRFEVSQGTM